MLEHDSEWQKAHPDFPPHMVSHMAEHDDCEDRKELCAISLTALLCLFPRSCRGQIVMKLCLISCLDKETGVSFGSECAWHWVSDWARWGLGLKPKGLSSGSDKNTGQGRSEICTVLLASCVGGRCNMPRPLQFDLWPVDLESGVRSHVTWATSVPILFFLGLTVVDLGPIYASDRRQNAAPAL